MSFGTTVTTWDSMGGSNPLMTILIVVFAVLLIGAIGRGLYVWMRNNRSPQETADARVIAKRMKVSGHGGTMMANRVSAMNTIHSSTRTEYFVTFEMENGRRLELGVKDPEYGMLAEGDRGRLSWQGTRYLGFERV
jgi:hypothetical protein